MVKYIAYSDGGCNNIKHNNAYASFKILIDDEVGIFTTTQMPWVHTSNMAEYWGLLNLVNYIMKNNLHKDSEWTIYMDSRLVVNQVNGKWKANFPHLIKVRNEIQEKLKEFDKFELIWTPRKNIFAQLGH